MSNEKLNLTRSQIAEIVNNDPRSIRAFELLLNSSGGAAWVNIDFTSSNITDILTRLFSDLQFTGSDLTSIETRNHNDLQNIGEADETSADTDKDKHVSNFQMKTLSDRTKSNGVLLWLSM